MGTITPAQLGVFEQTVLAYYRTHGRHDLPWRQIEPDGSIDPYKILVSELMLQQTQVPRVIPKFQEFMKRFATFESLAEAPLAEVLKLWSGLGYNRRAKFLWQAAQMVVQEYAGQLPRTSAELVRLPGVGANTAGALLAYAYNQPAVFIETNIRTAFIYHFFAEEQREQAAVHDKDILELVARALPDDARTWYWALMDYGTHLKQTMGNLNTLSKHYTKQSAFAGSRRQIRGQVLRLLSTQPQTLQDLCAAIADARLESVLEDLIHEGMMVIDKGRYMLP
ncbi:MAG TPA: hypothetical protein VJP80_07245 [Candidatus Saccharimonadales bacterium]|nr:hypothetical protein [Candidatus Saccharimonadales bacterium]